MRSALTKLATQSRELTFRILRALAVSLNQEKEFFVRCHGKMFSPDSITKLRSLYYPAITGPVQPGVVRCGEHSGKKHISLNPKNYYNSLKTFYNICNIVTIFNCRLWINNPALSR